MTTLVGNTAVSGSDTEGMNAARLRWYVFEAWQSGLADSLHAIFANTNNGALIKFAVYSNDGSLDLLASTTSVAIQATGEQLFALDSSVSIVQGESYRIAVISAGFPSFSASSGNITRFETLAGVRLYTDPFPQTLTGESSVGSARRVPGIWLSQSTPLGPSITTADNITTEGQTATFTLSGNTAAPTSATLNGVDVGTLADQGSAIYSYTAPLITDDDTADLVVSVDSTTVSATISYANSYDRDQLTHPATEAAYSTNSLSYPNAYGTSLPYEWKVVADAIAAVVVIDWDALEADDGFFKDIAGYATPVANGSTTVTLGVFVPETGEAYQFDRTINVSDGSVVVAGQGLWRELFRDPTEELFTELFR